MSSILQHRYQEKYDINVMTRSGIVILEFHCNTLALDKNSRQK